MKVRGTHRLSAPPEAVYRAICDPAVLLEILPGCEQIEQTGADEYGGLLTLRLPGVVGSYRTTVRLVDAVPPERAGMDGRLEGSMGSVTGRADFTLTAHEGGTTLAYAGSGVIQGPLARLDSRFAERLAESMISQGLKALDHRLATDAAPAGARGTRPTTEGSE